VFLWQLNFATEALKHRIEKLMLTHYPIMKILFDLPQRPAPKFATFTDQKKLK